MMVRDLRKILLRYKDEDQVVIDNNIIKVSGKFTSGDGYEELINSAGGTWMDGCGNAPDGRYCGECGSFDCDKCDWKERE